MPALFSPVVRTALVANLGFVVMVTIWGGLFPAIERVLLTWDVFSATAGRHSVAVLTLFTALMIFERRLPLPRSLPWRQLWTLGLFGMTATGVLTTLSISLSSGSAAAIVAATNPITSALTARLLYRVPLLPGLVAGAILSTAGGLFAIFAGGGSVNEFRGGEILMVVANVIWTWYSVMAQRWLAGYSQLQITALTTLTGLVGVFGVLAAVGVTGLVQLRVDLSVEPVLLLLFAGSLAVALGNFLWHSGVSRVGVAIGAMYNNLIPIVAVLIAFWAGTQPTAAQLVGGGMILAGVFYAQVTAVRARPAAQATAVRE